MNKREFLKLSFLSLSVAIFSQNKLFALSPKESLEVLLLDLLPLASSSNPNKYIQNIILKHSRIDKDYKDFILNGIKWINEESIEKHKKLYHELSDLKRNELLSEISSKTWADSYIYTMLGYLLECLLGDSIYGINKNKIGWIWLNHEGGYPSAKKAYL